MSRPLALPLLAAALALTTACGGPERPLDVGFKEVPSNVVLGAQSSPTPQAPGPGPGPEQPPLVPLPPPPSVLTLPPPVFEVPGDGPAPAPPLPPPSVPPCPKADPLQAPELEAPTSVAAPPADGAYLFRNEGTFEVSGADPRKGTFPESSLRVVKTTFMTDDGRVFDFTVADTSGVDTTTTTYRVVTGDAVLLAVEGTAEPGIYVTAVESRRGTEQSSFRPTPSLQLAAFPLQRGATVEARGVDVQTATTMSFTSTVTGKARVDACGTPLDSFTLELTEGRLLSAQADLDFAATYALGTQYGGLLLRETVAFAGTESGAGVTRTKLSTISQVPRAVTP